MKTDIKLQVTSEQSEVIQKICIFNKIYWKDTGSTLVENVKYIFISANSMTLSYQYRFFNNHSFEEVNPELFIRTNGTCVEPEETTIEATIEECQFEKYGFEKPDFKGEILKEYDDHLVGAVYQNEKYFGTSWNKQGTCLQTKGFGYINMDLTPIKKPWYETCKFPVLVWDDDNDLFVIRTRGEYTALYLNVCNPLTNDEIEGLKQ